MDQKLNVSTPTSERTPLIPPISPPLAGSSNPSSSVSSSYTLSSTPRQDGGRGKNKFRVGLDAAVVDNKNKWKRLAEINDDNSTAKNMADEVQHEFANLRNVQEQHFQQHLQQPETILSPLGSLFSFKSKNKEYENPFPIGLTAVALEVNKYHIAATFIKDGIHGRKIGYRLDRNALFLHEMFHSEWYRILYTFFVVLDCSLAFVEIPGQQNEYLLIDVICLFVFGLDVCIRWLMSTKETRRRFISRQPWAYVRLLLVGVTCIDLLINFLFPILNPNRYTRALRPFFLITRRRNIRIIFGSCLRALREVTIVLLLLFCLIGFFGLIGFLLFSDLSHTNDNMEAPAYFVSLSSSMYTMLLIHNCLPYMVKAMYEYYRATEWSAVFFIVFVLLTNLFLAKLTIAVSYKSYKKHTENMLYKRLQKRKAALYAAFDILADEIDLGAGGHGNVSLSTTTSQVLLPQQQQQQQQQHFLSPVSESVNNIPPVPSGPSSMGQLVERRGSGRYFVGVLDWKRSSFSHTASLLTPIQSRRISLESWLLVCEYLKPKWTHVEASLVFNTIDIEHLGALELTDFYQLCSLLNVHIERPYVSFLLGQICPSSLKKPIKKWKIRIKNLLLHEEIFFGYPIVIAELFVGVLICLSIFQAIQVNNMDLAYSLNSKWRLIGLILLCLFTIEVCLKLFAFGRREFFQRPFCKLDIWIALVGWCFYLTSFNNPNFPRVFYDLALAIRSLRILKLFNLIPPFHEILWTLKRIFPLILQLVLVIFCVIYAFGIFAQANYGILLQHFSFEKKKKVPQWFAVKEEFQFDTFERTLVTLFGVANLAGWDMVMDAAYVMTGSIYTLVFFFSYRITISNILLPIFVGFLVESFVSNAKTVETTIQTYVQAAEQNVALREKQNKQNPYSSSHPNVSYDGVTTNNREYGYGYGYDGATITSQSASSPISASSGEYKMRFERRASIVQNEMFDAAKLSDISRLKLLVDKKEEEIAENETHIRKLESNLLGMQNRLGQSQRVILAYEAKIEELSNQIAIDRAAALAAASVNSPLLAPSSSASSSIYSSSKRWRNWFSGGQA